MDETLDVGVDHGVDFLWVNVTNLVGAEDEASVVDKDVDVLGPFGEVVDDRVELLPVAHIEGDSGEVATGTGLALLVGGGTLLCCGSERIGSTSSEDNVAASACEQDGGGLADTTRGTGDKDRLVVEAGGGEESSHGCGANAEHWSEKRGGGSCG